MSRHVLNDFYYFYFKLVRRARVSAPTSSSWSPSCSSSSLSPSPSAAWSRLSRSDPCSLLLSQITYLIAKWPRLKTSNVWIFIGLLKKWKMAYAFNGNEKESTVNTGLKFSPQFIFPIFQEYERAVIFRLGRLLKSGARGPGVFFIIPCVDHYEKIDMRTQTYDVPPQEV